MSLPAAQQVARMTASLGHPQGSFPALSHHRFSSHRNSQSAPRQRSASRLSILSMNEQRDCAHANDRDLQDSSPSLSPVPASVSVALKALTASLTISAAASLTFTAPAVAEPVSPPQAPEPFLEASIEDIRRFQIDPSLVSASLESPPVISGGQLPGSIATALIHQEQQHQPPITSPPAPLAKQQRGNQVHQLAAARVDPADVDVPLAAPDSQVGREGTAPDASSAAPAPPVLDAAHVLSSSRLQAVQQQVEQLERETGWKVKVLTRDGKLPTSFRDAAAMWKVSWPSRRCAHSPL